MMRRRMLTIDPGLRGTGFVIWSVTPRALSAGVLIPPRSLDFVDRGRWLGHDLQRRFKPHQYDLVICEFPEYQSTASRAMGWQTGDLQRLTHLTGVFSAFLWPAAFITVEPHKWKGQLPKSVVEQRVTKRLGCDNIRKLGIHTHAFDAAGIGLWAIDERIWK